MVILSVRGWNKERACTFADWNYSNQQYGEPHAHDFHELFWVTAGRGNHLINGEIRPMQTGYLVLIRPSDYHTFKGDGSPGGVSFFNFAFRSSLWHNLKRRHPLSQNRLFDAPDLNQREFLLGTSTLERLRIISSDLASGNYDELTSTAFLYGVISMLVNRQSDDKTPPNMPSWLAEAVHQIRIYPHFTQGVKHLVALSGRSHEHVTRQCQLHLGVPPWMIILDARLRWAASQLASTEKKIIMIAMESGFENLGYFYSAFKKSHGMTPRTYRIRFSMIKAQQTT